MYERSLLIDILISWFHFAGPERDAYSLFIAIFFSNRLENGLSQYTCCGGSGNDQVVLILYTLIFTQ